MAGCCLATECSHKGVAVGKLILDALYQRYTMLYDAIKLYIDPIIMFYPCLDLAKWHICSCSSLFVGFRYVFLCMQCLRLISSRSAKPGLCTVCNYSSCPNLCGGFLRRFLELSSTCSDSLSSTLRSLNSLSLIVRFRLWIGLLGPVSKTGTSPTLPSSLVNVGTSLVCLPRSLTAIASHLSSR
jgi:hypothetical protein